MFNIEKNMRISSFQVVSTYDKTQRCPICHDPLGQEAVISHNGENGPKHPFHRRCLVSWVKRSGNTNCPTCFEQTNISSLMTWPEIFHEKLSIIKSVASRAIPSRAIPYIGLGLITANEYNYVTSECFRNNIIGGLKTIAIGASTISVSYSKSELPRSYRAFHFIIGLLITLDGVIKVVSPTHESFICKK
jgi:hypothetical protein